jgi:hypothetical protein
MHNISKALDVEALQAAARRHLQPTSSSPKKSADGDAYVTATNSSSPAGDSVTNIHSRECQVSRFDGHARPGHEPGAHVQGILQLR